MPIEWEALPKRPWTAMEYTEECYGVNSRDDHMNNVVEIDGGWEANLAIARVWAAAPDLYDTLQAFIEDAEEQLDEGHGCSNIECQDCGPTYTLILNGKRALAKAEGAS